MAAAENRDSFGRLAYILVKFSLPLMLSGILQQLYNWADAFIVGNVVGELALAAVGSTTSMVNFYVLAITGFTLGLSILFAQKFGARELEDIRRILSTFLWVLGGIFLILSAWASALRRSFCACSTPPGRRSPWPRTTWASSWPAYPFWRSTTCTPPPSGESETAGLPFMPSSSPRG